MGNTPTPTYDRERIRKFFVNQCFIGTEELDTNKALFTSGTLSSLDLIDLISFLEEDFGLKISTQDSEMGNFDSIDLIQALIAEKKKSA